MGEAVVGLIGVVVGASLTAWLEAIRSKATSRQDAATTALILKSDAEGAASSIRHYLHAGPMAGARDELNAFLKTWQEGGQTLMARWLRPAEFATAWQGFDDLRKLIGRGGGNAQAAHRAIDGLETAGDLLLAFSVEASRSLPERLSIRNVQLQPLKLPLAATILMAILITSLAIADDADLSTKWLVLGIFGGSAATCLARSLLRR